MVADVMRVSLKQRSTAPLLERQIRLFSDNGFASATRRYCCCLQPPPSPAGGLTGASPGADRTRRCRTASQRVGAQAGTRQFRAGVLRAVSAQTAGRVEGGGHVGQVATGTPSSLESH